MKDWDNHKGYCKKHGGYHPDHGCRTAVGTGSAYAEHSLGCPKGVGWGLLKGGGGLFAPNNEKQYPPWEAPAGNCPYCWHEKNPNKKITKLSAFGKKAKAGTTGM